MHIKIERVPETDRMGDWAEFEKRINALAEQGYKITKATEDYVIMEKQ